MKQGRFASQAAPSPAAAGGQPRLRERGHPGWLIHGLTLFDERCRRALTVATRPVPLITKSPELLAAAERLGIVVD